MAKASADAHERGGELSRKVVVDVASSLQVPSQRHSSVHDASAALYKLLATAGALQSASVENTPNPLADPFVHWFASKPPPNTVTCSSNAPFGSHGGGCGETDAAYFGYKTLLT